MYLTIKNQKFNTATSHRNTVEKHEEFSQANLEKSEIARVMSCLQRELNDFSINKSNDELQKQVFIIKALPAKTNCSNFSWHKNKLFPSTVKGDAKLGFSV